MRHQISFQSSISASASTTMIQLGPMALTPQTVSTICMTWPGSFTSADTTQISRPQPGSGKRTSTTPGVPRRAARAAEEQMAKKHKVGNLLALAVLSYLTQRPMHPYELGRTLREHDDARSIKYNHGSLYMVVGQLAKAGLITELETTRDGARPERTVYALTDAGRRELRDWLRELVEQPQHEYPQFVAALSLIAVLPPGEVVELLARRR